MGPRRRQSGQGEGRALLVLGVVLALAALLWWTLGAPGVGAPTPPEDVTSSEDGPPRLEGERGGAAGPSACTAPDGSAGRTLVVRVADETGEPIADALVYLLPATLAGVDDLDAATLRAWTPRDGTTAFAVEGAFGLGVQAGGFVPHVERVDLACGETRTVEVGLRRGGRISGRVQGEAGGAPVEDARVYCRAEPDPRVRLWTHPGLGGTPRVSELAFAHPTAGTFLLSGLPPGRYTLHAEAPGHLGLPVGDATPGDDVTIRLLPSARLTVRLGGLSGDARDRVEGVVRRREDGETVVGFSRPGTPRELEVTDGLAPGEYEVDVEHVSRAQAGGGQGTAPFSVRAPGEAVLVEMDLSPLVVLALDVSDGGPLDGHLRVEPLGTGTSRLHAVRGAPGHVALRPGRYRVAYVDPLRVSRPREVDVRPGGVPRETLDLERPTRVHVRGTGVSDLSVADRAGGPRPVALFRGGVPLRVEEHVAVQAGDLCVLPAEAGLVVRLGDEGHPSFPLEPGRDHVLGEDGLQVEEASEGG